MKIIVISPEDNDYEIKVLIELFDAGLTYFHLRKQNAVEDGIRNYLNQIPQNYYDRIILHSYHSLAIEYNLKGIHYTEVARQKISHIHDRLHISSSFHKLEELKSNKIKFDYVFLSPIFNSISKACYSSAFDLKELKESLPKINQDVIALGGVNAQRIPDIKEAGFTGIALMGALWNNTLPVESFLRIKELIDKDVEL